jgi:hypothetical protein
MLVSFKGRNSGKDYTIPVNYVQYDNILLVISYRYRTWWRNLREDVPVSLRVRGQTLKGIGLVITSEAEVVKHLQIYLIKAPKRAKYFNVTLDPDGNPNLGDLVKAAQDRVGVQIQLENI